MARYLDQFATAAAIKNIRIQDHEVTSIREYVVFSEAHRPPVFCCMRRRVCYGRNRNASGAAGISGGRDSDLKRGDGQTCMAGARNRRLRSFIHLY